MTRFGTKLTLHSSNGHSSSSGIDVKELNEKIMHDLETGDKMPEEMREKLLKYAQGELDEDESKTMIGDMVKEALDVENEKLSEQNQEQLAEILENDENYNCPENAEKNDKNALIQEDMPDTTHSYLNKVKYYKVVFV